MGWHGIGGSPLLPSSHVMDEKLDELSHASKCGAGSSTHELIWLALLCCPVDMHDFLFRILQLVGVRDNLLSSYDHNTCSFTFPRFDE